MFDKRYSTLLLAAGSVALAGLGLSSAANGAQTYPPRFEMASTTFEDGGAMPRKMAMKKTAEFPLCFGDNVSPQLSWKNPPPGVKSYAITMNEVEGGADHTDLVVYGIPANVTSFAEGELNNLSPKFTGGKALRSANGTWHGMCTPANIGQAYHHYIFKIWATDLDPKALKAGLDVAELNVALKDHSKGTAYLIAKSKRPEGLTE